MSQDQTLRDFIAARETDIKAQIASLQDELRDLRAAKAAIEGGAAPRREQRQRSRMTHREMIRAALDARPEGGTSDRVIVWVRDDFGAEISQASISSQLSRLKSEGGAVLDPSAKIWRSIKHATELDKEVLRAMGALPFENEPPENGSDDDAEDAEPSPASELPPSLPGT